MNYLEIINEEKTIIDILLNFLNTSLKQKSEESLIDRNRIYYLTSNPNKWNDVLVQITKLSNGRIIAVSYSLVQESSDYSKSSREEYSTQNIIKIYNDTIFVHLVYSPLKKEEICEFIQKTFRDIKIKKLLDLK